MTDPKDIPHLVKLLDDDSRTVQDQILKKLASFGSNLKLEVEKLPFPLTSSQKDSISRIYNQQKRIEFLTKWPGWYKYHNPYERLEMALSIIAEYLDEGDQKVSISVLLNDLCEGFKARYFYQDCRLLARYLFQDLKIRGNQEDYYNSQNSNLRYVIENQKGIPISLTSIYMLIGYRLGINIEGCHFPGHFLAQVDYKGKPFFVDCFSSGRFIHMKDILKIRREVAGNLEMVFEERADVDTMIRRFLANLIRVYQMSNDEENARLFIKLFKELDQRLTEADFSEITPEDIISANSPDFEISDIVVHKRYGYRGIIVDSDYACKATDSWYYNNQTQPMRNQPWYHVLVHDTNQVTYVAESSLIRDLSGESVNHPLVSYFFEVLEEGRYLRNHNPWPETDF